ncbi:hypothetical protein [Cardinium endosymbiont of Tipula unca]|uniref:hypothetical protein n=1 Tax=Cardinium endosymbiont of Tipula unca TaxID=3066216 RepID=UPI0030D1DC7A
MKLLIYLYNISLLVSTIMLVSCQQKQKWEVDPSSKEQISITDSGSTNARGIKRKINNDIIDELDAYFDAKKARNKVNIKEDWGKIKLTEINTPTRFWRLFDELRNDKSELVYERDLILNAFINGNLYGLEVEETDSMFERDSLEEDGFCENTFMMLPCFCIAKEKVDHIPEIVWVHKRATGNKFDAMMLEQLRGIVAKKQPDSQLSCGFYLDKNKSRLKQIDTVKEFWYLFDWFLDDKSNFIHNREEILSEFKSGALYGLKKQEATFTNNSEPLSYLLPCFCSVFKDGTDNVACMMWVHTQARKSGLGRQLVELLEIKKAYDPQPNSLEFWNKCGVTPYT